MASASPRVTSTSVRITASGVRSSWLAFATKRRWLSKAASSRASIASNVSASSFSSSGGPSSAIRSSSVSSDSRRAVAVTRLTGCSARPASTYAAAMPTTAVTAKTSPAERSSSPRAESRTSSANCAAVSEEPSDSTSLTPGGNCGSDRSARSSTITAAPSRVAATTASNPP